MLSLTQLTTFALLAAGQALADKVKLNQYANGDDCGSDSNILYHAAPVSGKCYNFDDKTGSYFYNSGGMLNIRVYPSLECNGDDWEPKPYYSDGCQDKGSWKSIKMW